MHVDIKNNHFTLNVYMQGVYKELIKCCVLPNAMHVHVGSDMTIPDVLIMMSGIGGNFRHFCAASEVLL